jgi:hypothetical protein
VLLVWCFLLYGVWSAGVFLVAGAAAAALGGRRPVFWGALAFTLLFWFFSWNYGLTYDEVPGAAGAWAMLGWLALRTALLLALAWPAARLLEWALLALGWTRAGRRAALATVLLLLAIHLLVPAVRAPGEEEEERVGAPAAASRRREAAHPVILVGVDGADWRVIDPLLADGDLPNLRRLIDGGVRGELATFRGANSAVLWASIYTGRSPADHAIHDFYRVRLAGMRHGVWPVHRSFFKELAGLLDRTGGAARLAERDTVDRADLEAPLLWEVVGILGETIGVVDGYLYAYPAPPLARPESFFLAYGAGDFFKRLRGGERETPTDLVQVYVRPPALLARLAAELSLPEFGWQSAALLSLLETGQPAFVNLYTHEPDAVQHLYWRAHEPRAFFGVVPDEVAREGQRIPDFYRRLDAFLGELVERMAPGTVLIVASDHGHSPTLLHAMDTQHRHGPPGILLLYGGPVAAGLTLESAHILDLFPTALHLLGYPVPRDAAGRVLAGAFTGGFAAVPVAGVATYDSLPVPTSTATPADRERNEEELEKLRALGYIR